MFGSQQTKVTPMVLYNAGTTNPTLLNRLGDWRDHEAWVDFLTRYDPVIRLSSRRYRLDAESTEELCQRVWIDLARLMRTFRYDPGKTFRGWLLRLCQSRAIDLLRKKNADAVFWLEDQPVESLLQEASADLEAEEEAGAERPRLLHLADEVQNAVRQRVSEQTWQVFWNIAVLGQSVRETSAAAGISYYAAFAAEKRVGRMLREEGKRLLAEPRQLEPEVRRTGD
jgi:RNA polymerase sigma factor (sigma-70 family)